MIINGEKMKIVVSSCLLGNKCKYNGQDNYQPEIAALLKGHTIIPVCPEVFGGLPIPRKPCEIVGEIVMDRNFVSKDREYRIGAEKALQITMDHKAQLAILQSRSPSCGVHHIYDGTFTKKLITGNGIFAGMLKEANIPCYDMEDMEQIRCILKKMANDSKKQ